MRPTQSLSSTSVPLLRRVFAGCRPSLLGEGRSRRYLCNPCRGVWAPTPPHSSGALVRFFPENIGLTIWVSRSACEKLSVMQLQQSPLFRGCRHSLMFRLHDSLDPRVAPTVAPSVPGGWALYTTQNLGCYLPKQWHHYMTEPDNCHSRTFTCWIAALSAAPTHEVGCRRPSRVCGAAHNRAVRRRDYMLWH